MRALILLLLMMSVRTARGDVLDVVEVVASESELRSLLDVAEMQTDEPFGLKVTNDDAKLKLKAGDIIRAINGGIAEKFIVSGTLTYLDVARGTKQFVVRVSAPNGPRTFKISRDDLAEILGASRFHAAKYKGVLVGVRLTKQVRLRQLDQADLIRKIDGVATTSATQANEAMTKGMANKQIVLDVERMGAPSQVTIVLEGAVGSKQGLATELSKIVRVSDTEYEVPQSLVDTVTNDAVAAAAGARVVPAMKNGKAQGLKFYAIRPSSLYAQLGLANGDTLISINGLSITSTEQALELYPKLRSMKVLAVQLERRGKPVEIRVRVK